MKVLVITPSYFPIVGGSETLTRNLVYHLNKNNIHTDIMTINMDKKWSPKWKDIVENTDKYKIFKVSAFNLFKKVNFNPLESVFKINVIPNLNYLKIINKYDILHFLGEADLSLLIFSYLMNKPKIMHCVGLQHLYLYFKNRYYLRFALKKLLPTLADTFLISSTEEMVILNKIGINKSKISLFPDSIDTNLFNVDFKKKCDNIILFVGRIDKVKGIHVLLQAMFHINFKTKLFIIGPIFDEDYYQEINEVSKEINELGIHEVRYLGSMEHEELVEWYQKATILVCPYLEETGSQVCLEASACGTPVIRTADFHSKDGIGSVNDLIVPRNDPEKLAKMIEMMLLNKKLRDKYSKEGRKHIEELYSWDNNIEILVNIYKNILKPYN